MMDTLRLTYQDIILYLKNWKIENCHFQKQPILSEIQICNFSAQVSYYRIFWSKFWCVLYSKFCDEEEGGGWCGTDQLFYNGPWWCWWMGRSGSEWTAANGWRRTGGGEWVVATGQCHSHWMGRSKWQWQMDYAKWATVVVNELCRTGCAGGKWAMLNGPQRRWMGRGKQAMANEQRQMGLSEWSLANGLWQQRTGHSSGEWAAVVMNRLHRQQTSHNGGEWATMATNWLQ